MIEQDDAVGNIFLQSVTRKLVAPALSRDDSRHALVLQPAEKPAQLGAQDDFVAQAAEQSFQRVEHDALGADGIDRMVEPDEQPFQVVVAALLKFARFDMNVIEHDFFAPDQIRQVEPERRDVGRQLHLRLLEGHQHARLAELHGATHEKFRGQQRLATSSAAADQRGPALRHATARDFIEALDAGRRLRQGDFPRGGFGSV